MAFYRDAPARNRDRRDRPNRLKETLEYSGSHLTYQVGMNAGLAAAANSQSTEAQIQSALIDAFLHKKDLKRPKLPRHTESAEQKFKSTCLDSFGNGTDGKSETKRARMASSFTVDDNHRGAGNRVAADKQCDRLSSEAEWLNLQDAKKLYDSWTHDSLTGVRNASHAFLELSASTDSNARLTMENYREKISDLIRRIKRNDLLPVLTRGHQTSRVHLDPVEAFYMSSSAQFGDTRVNGPVLRSHTRRTQQTVNQDKSTKQRSDTRTCDVKMRVRIQYKSHDHVLSNIDSVKNSQEERQFDKYFQATSIMRSRDTGCVVCDISFTDITYLGAFWRDYTNGALQEALRAVFLTEMMRQTAGDEELDLFVTIDENDFFKGQMILIDNLSNNGSRKSHSLPVRSLGNTARIER